MATSSTIRRGVIDTERAGSRKTAHANDTEPFGNDENGKSDNHGQREAVRDIKDEGREYKCWEDCVRRRTQRKEAAPRTVRGSAVGRDAATNGRHR